MEPAVIVMKEPETLEDHLEALVAEHGFARLLGVLANACLSRSAECRRDCDQATASHERAATGAAWHTWEELAATLDEAFSLAELEGV